MNYISIAGYRAGIQEYVGECRDCRQRKPLHWDIYDDCGLCSECCAKRHEK
jgi:hypothetical protein